MYYCFVGLFSALRIEKGLTVLPVSPHFFALIYLSRFHLPDGVHLGLVVMVVEGAIVSHIDCKDKHNF